jgi:hypothetical protein
MGQVQRRLPGKFSSANLHQMQNYLVEAVSIPHAAEAPGQNI